MEEMTTNFFTIYNIIHSRDYIDWLYVSRKEGRKQLPSIRDSIAASIQWLEAYTKKIIERLFTSYRYGNQNVNSKAKQIRKQKWEEKQLIGYFKWETIEITYSMTWAELRKESLKRETEFY